jgi:hypothetical protein
MLIRGVGLFGRTLLEMAKRLGRNIADELRGTTKYRDRFVEKLMRGVLAMEHLDMMLYSSQRHNQPGQRTRRERGNNLPFTSRHLETPCVWISGTRRRH